jgi:[ribosomal protein S5]-alanine N-acetyltransferase
MALHTISTLPGFPELRGMRTRLRAPRAGDGERLRELVRDPSEWFEACAAFLAAGERIDWVVTTRRDDAAIGTCTLYAIDTRLRRAEIGYALRADHRGHGLAMDAAARVIEWAEGTLGLECIEAEVDDGNAPSRRLLRRLGFIAVEARRWARLHHSDFDAGSI